MNNREIEIARAAFLAGYHDSYEDGVMKCGYHEQEAWDDYQKTLQAENLVTCPMCNVTRDAGPEPIDPCGCSQQQPTPLPEDLREHTEVAEECFMEEQEAGWHRDHDRLLLEEVFSIAVQRVEAYDLGLKDTLEHRERKLEQRILKKIIKAGKSGGTTTIGGYEGDWRRFVEALEEIK